MKREGNSNIHRKGYFGGVDSKKARAEIFLSTGITVSIEPSKACKCKPASARQKKKYGAEEGRLGPVVSGGGAGLHVVG